MDYTDEQAKIDPRAHISVRPRDVELGVSLDHNVVIDVFAGYKSSNAKLQVGMDFVARTHNNDLYACAAVLKVGAIGPIKTIGIVVMGTPLGTAVGHSWVAPGISSGHEGDPGAWRSSKSLEA